MSVVPMVMVRSRVLAEASVLATELLLHTKRHGDGVVVVFVNTSGFLWLEKFWSPGLEVGDLMWSDDIDMRRDGKNCEKARGTDLLIPWG